MGFVLRSAVFCLCLVSLVACDQEPEAKAEDRDLDRLTAVRDEPGGTAAVTVPPPVARTAAGGVNLHILPENPTVLDCLSMVVEGVPGRSALQWTVNGQQLAGQGGRRLCSDHFHRGDRVTAAVGTRDAGASMTVTIGNAPPRVVDISATPDQVFAGHSLTVFPVAEDADGDQVDFRYQWLINGEQDTFLNEATLPGEAFTRGDTIQVLITPTDGLDDGEVYQSYAMTIPNAPPSITSSPAQNFEAYEYSYQVEVSDPDDEILTFALNDPPAGMIISATGLITWPLSEVEPGDYRLSIIVTDAAGETATQEFTLSLEKTVFGTEG